jgi:hypothetical protein
MSDREHHCPFLNRADHRCAAFFSIERLQHAFEHCFHAYKSCEVYQELLVERQARRGQIADGLRGSGSPGQFVWTTACPSRRESDVTTRFVQVRLPRVAAATVAGQNQGAGQAAAAAAR